MIVVIVKQPVRAKYADEWPSLVEEFTTSTRAEPGNISFDWYRSAEDPNLWILIEVFRDRHPYRTRRDENRPGKPWVMEFTEGPEIFLPYIERRLAAKLHRPKR